MDEKKSSRDTDSDKDEIVSVSPGKQYVRGGTQGEKRVTAIQAANAASRKSLKDINEYKEDSTPENWSKYDKSSKANKMLMDAYDEEADKGYKKGGMVAKKDGGSVRGAGVAQRGQGKMRVF